MTAKSPTTKHPTTKQPRASGRKTAKKPAAQPPVRATSNNIAQRAQSLRRTKAINVRHTSLSTGDLARHCRVTPATIVNWIRAGKLDVYETPGGQYRMEKDKFIAFLNSAGLPVPPELQAGRVKRVMVVDDDIEIANLLAEALLAEGAGYEVAVAENGFDALIALGDFKPDVISLDLMMPKMDGVELVRRIRSNPVTKATRILILSGMANSSVEVRRAKRIGVEAHLSKPANLDDFLETIAKLAETIV